MHIEIDINTNGAAFEDDNTELHRILTTVANQVADGYKNESVKDINGNTVCTYKVTGE